MSGTKKHESIEGIDSSSSKGTTWWYTGDPFYSFEVHQEEKKAITLPPDTISSAQPQIPLAEPQASAKVESTDNSNTVNRMMNKIWNFLWTPLASDKTTEGQAAQSNVTQPASTTKSKGIGGAPAIDEPFQVNREDLQKLLVELRKLNHQIEKTNHDGEEELQDRDRQIQTFVLLLNYLKKQKQMRDNGIFALKFDLDVLNNSSNSTRKKLVETDKLWIEINKDHQWWRTANTITSWASFAIVTASVTAYFASFYFTGGLAAAFTSLFASSRAVSCITQATLAGASGFTEIMKGHLEHQQGVHKKESVILKGKYTELNVIIKMQMDQMFEGFNKTQKINEWIQQVLKNQRSATQSINSMGSRGSD